MIRISEDGKTFVEIAGWEDVISRPGYQSGVNPKDTELKQILGQYILPEPEPCGISTCRTKHKRGYLVAIAGGHETNIGNVCGKRIFGVDFTEQKNTFTRAINAQRYREAIQSAINGVAATRESVESLKGRDKGADWCHREMHAYMTRLFPETISRPLTRRASHGEGIVNNTVALTEDEKESRTGDFRSNFREELVFVIQGVTAVARYRKLPKLLDVHLTDELNALVSLEPDGLSYTELGRWHKWVNKIEPRLNEAEAIIDECNRFLAPSNIENIRNHRSLL